MHDINELKLKKKQFLRKSRSRNEAVRLLINLAPKYIGYTPTSNDLESSFAEDRPQRLKKHSTPLIAKQGEASVLVNRAVIDWLSHTSAGESTKNWFIANLLSRTFKLTHLSQTENRKERVKFSKRYLLPWQFFAIIYNALRDTSEAAWPVPQGSTPFLERKKRLHYFDQLNEILAQDNEDEYFSWLVALDGYAGHRLLFSDKDVQSHDKINFIRKLILQEFHIDSTVAKDPVGVTREAFINQFTSIFLPWLLDKKVPNEILNQVD